MVREYHRFSISFVLTALKKVAGKCRLAGFLVVLILFSAILLPEQANAQVRSGSAFLKILPGVRNQGLSGGYTGYIDEIHTFYANPAATGLLREWQWSTSYTEWIADTYSLSWIYGRKVGTPWSQRSKFALGIHYQGVRDFNSTNNPNEASASANDALFSLSLGQPIGGLSENLSLGTNIQFFRSQLDGVASSSWVFDLGLLYRTGQIALDNFLGFEYAVLSAGAAVNQLGQPLKFLVTETPLPRTFRTGAAINLGSHDGLQVQLAADYENIRDETGRFSIGGEVFWRYQLGVRGGYNFNENLLSKFSLGVSYRWGNTEPLPGRKNAVRLDFAYLENNDFFSAPLRGGLNHYPLGPESFSLSDNGEIKSYAETDSILLGWEATRDPDLYDTVGYSLFMVKDDSTALKQLLTETAQDQDFLLDVFSPAGAELTGRILYGSDNGNLRFEQPDSGKAFDWISTFGKLDTVTTPHHLLVPDSVHQAGLYSWAVIAHDRDLHTRVSDNIAHFRILPPPPPPPPPIEYDLDVITDIEAILRPNVNFQFSGDQLTDEAKEQLDILVAFIKSLEADGAVDSLYVHGHTDPVGSAAYNLNLSKRRAKSVGTYLRPLITPIPVSTEGFGESRLLMVVDSKLPRTQRDSLNEINRRVEIHLEKDKNPVKAVYQSETIGYTYVVRNAGPDSVAELSFEDVVPLAAQTADSGILHQVISDSLQALLWQFSDLAAGDSLTIKLPLVVDSIPAGLNAYKLVSNLEIRAENDIDSTNNRSVNTVYIVPAQAPEKLPQIVETEAEYIVKPGDTLGEIAKEFSRMIRTEVRWQTVYRENKAVIGENPNRIKPGQKLVIKMAEVGEEP